MESEDEQIQNLVDRLRCVHWSLQHRAGRLLAEGKEEMRSEGERLNRLQDDLSNLVYDLGQEKELKNHVEAFRRAEEFVRMMGEESPTGTLRIMILAVSSSFSWPFITTVLPEILACYEEFSVDLEWLLVHPSCLKSAGVNGAGQRWEDLSKGRERQLKAIVAAFPEPVGRRFKINLSYYKNLPHWHGVLLNDTELLLGRASWSWVEGIPNLRVGENEYRILNLFSPKKGGRRIELFKDWFRYYQMSSEPLDPE